MSKNESKKKIVKFQEMAYSELRKEDADEFKKQSLTDELKRSWWRDQENTIDLDLRGVTTIDKEWLEKTVEVFFHVHDDSRDVLRRMRFGDVSEENARIINEWLQDCFGLSHTELGVRYLTRGPTGGLE